MERVVVLVMGKWQERALVSAQLQEEGYRVKSFPDLETAAAFLCRTPSLPDVVVLDLRGVTVTAEKLRALKLLLGEVPLVLCTAPYGRDQEAEEILKPAEILVRPFTIGEVVEAVRRLAPLSRPTS